jgi:hypothetical protein
MQTPWAFERKATERGAPRAAGDETSRGPVGASPPSVPTGSSHRSEDQVGIKTPLRQADERFPRLSHLWLDAGYRGVDKGDDWAEKTLGWSVDLVERPRKPLPDEVPMSWAREWSKEGVAVDWHRPGRGPRCQRMRESSAAREGGAGSMGWARARPRRLPYVAATGGASADRHIFLDNLMPNTVLESRAKSAATIGWGLAPQEPKKPGPSGTPVLLQRCERPDRGTWRGVNPRPDTGLPNLTCLPLNVVNFRCSVFKDAPDGDEYLLSSSPYAPEQNSKCSARKLIHRAATPEGRRWRDD